MSSTFEPGQPSRPVYESRPARNWTRLRDIPLTFLAWGAVIISVFWLAGHISQTLIYIAIASLLAYALTPAVNWLSRYGPRWLAITVVYLIFSGLIAALVYIIVNAATPQVAALATYVKALLTPGQNAQNAQFSQFLSRIGISPTQLNSITQNLLGQAQGLLGNVVPVVQGIFSAGLGIIVVLVMSIYFVADAPRIGHWLRTRTPLAQRERVVFVVETLNRVVGGYIRGQVTLALLVGVLVGVGMQFIFHLPFGILLGILAFVLEFIPFIGVFISGLACVLVALTQGIFVALLVLGYFVIIHVIEGDVVGPRIVGWAVGLHPVVSLISLIAGAELFGLWGALFASPVAGMFQALFVAFWSEYRRTHPEQFPNAVPSDEPPDGRPRSDDTNPNEDPVQRHKRDLDGGRGIFFRRRGPDAPHHPQTPTPSRRA